MPRNVDARGRNKVARHIRLDHALLESPAFRSLSPIARALLVELAMLCKGASNNGALWLSERDAADRLGLADRKAVRRAFGELGDMGFVAMTGDGTFAVKAGEGRARTWRLTWEAVAGRMGPSNDWRDRLAPVDDDRAMKRMTLGLAAIDRHRKKIARENSSPARRNSGEDSSPWHENSDESGEVSSPAKSKNSNVFHLTDRGGILPTHRIPGDRGQDLQIAEGRAVELRHALQRLLAEPEITARMIALHPACRFARVSESRLSTFRNRPGARLRVDQAEAIMKAIDDLKPCAGAAGRTKG